MRRVLTQLLTLVFRVFFARADVVGNQLVPLTGPVFFVINHPNALIDALCMFVLSPRPVSILAKSTLFTMPIIGTIVRGMDSLPVYRRQDIEADPRKNAATFTAARDLLQRGGALAVFPEGVSHDDTTLRPLKTGAARIALGANAMQDANAPLVQVVPASLFYTDKRTLRSSVLLHFGEPIAVPRQPLIDGEPPVEAVQLLTAQIATSLGALTLQHAGENIAPLLARAAEILASEQTERISLLELKDLQQRLARAHQTLTSSHAPALQALVEAVRSYDRELEAAGIPSQMDLTGPATSALQLMVLLPLAVVGIPLHYPAYWLIGKIAMGKAGSSQDMLATLKVLGGLVFFPLTYGIATAALWPWLHGWLHGLLLLLPLTGYAALLFTESLETQAMQRRLASVRQRLQTQRAQIRADMSALAALLETHD